MTNGPPPSSAGPSHILAQSSSPAQSQTQPTDSYPQYRQPAPVDSQSYPSQASNTLNQGQPYYKPGEKWQQNAWQVPSYRYTSGAAPYQQYSQGPYPQYQPQQQQSRRNSSKTQISSQPQPPMLAQIPRTLTPSPPPPEFHRHWDAVIASFLSGLGLTQALRGFENDMLVMNEDWERQKVPKAIGELMRDLMSLGQSPNIDRKERSLEERKLDYTHFAKGTEPRTQTSINKSISTFLAQNRARNDASNRAEFLESLAEKRRKLNPDMDESDPASVPEITSSCARADAKTLDRDVQMKYDIAKNEEGPLRRTVKVGATSQDAPDIKSKQRQSMTEDDGLSRERHPGLDERLVNIETHLSVRYVPSPPRSLLDRLKFLEDHIIQLEKEYPPWAALHFNQPHRGWPPPPRPTPIIVPSHLTSASNVPQLPTAPSSKPPASAQSAQSTGTRGKAKNPKSSLHRAVMEKLEVQKAMSDLAGRGGGNAEENG